jgi:hypothetical protein
MTTPGARRALFYVLSIQGVSREDGLPDGLVMTESAGSDDLLPHEQGRLGIVVIAFATPIPTSLIESDRCLEVVVAVQVNPLDTLVASELLLCIEQTVGNMVSAGGGFYV